MSQQQGQQTQNTSGQPQQDYSKAWEEYFKRTGQHAQAAAVAQQTSQQSPAQQQPATTKTEPGATNGGSQPDYSAQWAEYYRKLAEYQKANGGQQ